MCVQLRIPAATAEELNRCIEMLEQDKSILFANREYVMRLDGTSQVIEQ
jgi:hypothetical protein